MRAKIEASSKLKELSEVLFSLVALKLLHSSDL